MSFDPQELSPEEQKARQERDVNTIALLAYLFHNHYCPECGIDDPVLKGKVLPVVFLAWLRDKIDKNLIDRAGISEGIGTTQESWAMVDTILLNLAGPEMITPTWFAISMADRNDQVVKHPVKQVLFSIQIQYEDGRIALIGSPLTPSVLPVEPRVLTDAAAANYAFSCGRNFSQMIVDYGLDGMWERANDMGGEEPLNMMMGCILKMIPTLHPSYQEPVKAYMRFVQLLVQPPDPKRVPKPKPSRLTIIGGGGFDG